MKFAVVANVLMVTVRELLSFAYTNECQSAHEVHKGNKEKVGSKKYKYGLMENNGIILLS